MKNLIPAFILLGLLTLMGCHSKEEGVRSSPPVAQATPLPPSGVDWTKVAAFSPQPSTDLTLWLKADGKVTLAPDGVSVASWSDESSNHLEFKKTGTDREGPTLVKKTEWGTRPTIRFGGNDQQLETAKIPGSKLIGPEGASLFMVMLQDAHYLHNSTFGWGGCGENRFNTHFTFDHSLIFQMGNPGISAVGAAAPAEWADHPHLVSVVVRGAEARVNVDGTDILVNPNFKKSIKIEELAPIIIAGICGTGFKGDISEIVLYKKGFDKKKALPVMKYLSAKYGIALR
jgi:hypothetical protein